MARLTFLISFLFIGNVSSLVIGSPRADDGSLNLTTSTSGNYDSRNVFTNPAGLGFQTRLNGAQVSTAYGYTARWNAPDDFSFALAWGYLGLGIERLSTQPAGETHRYALGLGIPLSDLFYLGTRYRLNSTDLSDSHSIDLGLQYRPLPWWSFGMLVQDVNRPLLNGARSPAQLVLGTQIKPGKSLELTLDFWGYLNRASFDKKLGYQGMVGWEFSPGFQVRGGYHSELKYQAALQISFGSVSLFSQAQMDAGKKTWVTGFQASTLPYRAAINREAAAVIRITPELGEELEESSLFVAANPSLWDLVDDLRKLSERSDVSLVVIKLPKFPLGFSSAYEVYKGIESCRKAGKTTIVFLGNAGLKEYYIASAANQIYIEPSGGLEIAGLKAEKYFFKGGLKKLGIEGEFLAKGAFKSAPETFTRQESSPAHRNATLEQLTVAEDFLIEEIGRYRRFDRASWKELLEIGLISSETALEKNWVDGIQEYAKQIDLIESNRAVLSSFDEQSERLNIARKIAVISVDGSILSRKPRALRLSGEALITPKLVETRLRRAVSDKRVDAIVLRVNSPGGEVLASQEIATLVERAQKQKPVVISMGDVAASGGYFISAPGTKILATPGTLTGSIGVFLGKLTTEELYKKIDIRKEVLSHAPYPSLFSEHHTWTESEKRILQKRLDAYYQQFVGYVAKQRALALVDVEQAAQGRVWLGKQALSRKLVDGLGGYQEAIQTAASLAQLENGDFTVSPIRTPRGLMDLIEDLGEVQATAGLFHPVMGAVLSKKTLQDLSWIAMVSEPQYLYLSTTSPLQ